LSLLRNLAAISRKAEVEAEVYRYREPQPLVTLSWSQIWLPSRRRLRLRNVDIEILSLH